MVDGRVHVEQAIKDFWIDKLSDWSNKNSKELANTKKDLNNRLKDLYWDDEAWYIVAKSHLENQYYENIYNFYLKELIYL
jgi:hypothetical protein